MEFWRELGSAIALGVSAALVIISRIPKQTIDEQQKLIQTLTERLDQFEKDKESTERSQKESMKAIATLQGKIDVIKDIPLGDIAKAMEEMNVANKQIAKSNDLILKTLRSSAVIAADHLEANQTVQEQTVVHQTVENQE